MADIPRYYWDTCGWLGLLNGEEAKLTVLKHLWGLAQKGQCEIWTSTYTYIELVYGHVPHGQPYNAPEDDQRIFDMLEQPFVKRVQLDQEIAKVARRLRREHNSVLKKRADAIHLASAAHYNVTELHTWDGSDLLPLNGIALRRDGSLLPIRKPGIGDDTPLMRAAASAAGNAA